jgi:hypothetical protein
MPESLQLEVLNQTYAVCRLSNADSIPKWATSAEFLSITRTHDELSIVCEVESVPDGVQAERNFRGLRVVGPLDFALTGIMAALTTPLAAAGISIFAISTYDTDYLFVRADRLDQAIGVLRDAGMILLR